MERSIVSKKETYSPYPADDLFKPALEQQDVDAKSVNSIYLQYEWKNESYCEPIKHCLGVLMDYCETMALHNSALVDNAIHKQSVMDLLTNLAQALHALQQASRSEDFSLSAREILTHAADYSILVIKTHCELLEKYQPDSLALKWYRDKKNPLNKF